MNKQSVQSQKGEIQFRKKLVSLQTAGEKVIDDEYTGSEIEQILKSRMDKTVQQMSEFIRRKLPVSPYIEIGAERGQRSLIMENDIGASGAAVDISFDMLKSCAYYAGRFKKSKQPVRICGDVYNLPFKAGSVPFIFCYETLHHFPKPGPVISELFRVLSPGGYFFFDEEPFKKMLHLNVYKKDKIYSEKARKKSRIRSMVDYFFAQNVCNEIEYGIIENHAIPLHEWRAALSPFDHKQVQIFSAGSRINADLCNWKSHSMRYFMAYLLGGTVKGLCKKAGSLQIGAPQILDCLICPACRDAGREILLRKADSLFMCEGCGTGYTQHDDVLFLLTPQKKAELYPEI